MNKRYPMLIAFMFLGIIPTLSADELFVCKDRTYKTIQDAVNAARPGANIHVCAGTYAEQVTVAVNDVRIVADGRVIVVEPKPAKPYGFKVSGQDVEIRGFEITGFADQTLSAGILVDHAAHVTIGNNIIYGNCNGVWLNGAPDATLTGNNLSQNPYPDSPVAERGIPEPPPGQIVPNSCDVVNLDPITGMAIVSTDGYGVKSIGSKRLEIKNNKVAQNGECGIQVSGDSGGTTISNNRLMFNTGVNVTPCGNIDVRNVSGAANEVSVQNNRIDLGSNGVMLTGSDHISVENNTITRNSQGIQLVKSDRNTVTKNTAHNNMTGIFMTGQFNVFEQNALNTNDNQGIVVFLLGCPDPSVTVIGQTFDTTKNNRFQNNTIKNNGGSFKLDVLDFSILSGTQCPMDFNPPPPPTTTLDTYIDNDCDVSIPAFICAGR